MNSNKKAPKVLIFDDSPSVLKSLERALTLSGFEVKTSLSLRHAGLTIMKEQPDILVLDVDMSDDGLKDISGSEFLQILRRLKCFTPAVLCSSRSEPELQQLAIDCQADGWIHKSGNVQSRLVEEIEKVLQSGIVRSNMHG